MRNIIPGAAALAAAALTLTVAACGSSAPSGGPPAGTGTPAATSPAATSPATPGEAPLPAAGSWTVPAYPNAESAAKAAGCAVVPFHPEPRPWVDSVVNCTTPNDDISPTEISIAAFRTPADEQKSVDLAPADAEYAGDYYLVKGKGWLATCINVGNDCRYIQAKIGGDFQKVTP